MSRGNFFTGTLNMLILFAVRERPMHGYAIGRWIRETSAGVLGVEEGQLYPALHRLDQRGWLRSDWGRTETGRRAKYYSLTSTGRAVLERERASWEQYSDAVDSVLSSPPR